MKNFNLQRQLKSQGASSKDAKALSGVAKNIGNAELPGLSPEAKKRIAAEIGIGSSPFAFFTIPRLAIGGALALIALLIGFSQVALPGSPLYSIKRGTEEVRLLLQPGFTQQDVEDRRADEQRRLDSNRSTDDDSGDTTEDNHDSSEDARKSSAESGGDHKSSDENSDDSSGSNSGSSSTSGSNTSGSGSSSNSSSSGDSGSNSASSGGSGSNSGSGSGSGGHGSDD